MSAHADVWQQAIDRGSPTSIAREQYDQAIAEGDEHALEANLESASRPEIRHQLEQAVKFYRKAATLRPTEAEPYFRIAKLLYAFYLESCGEQQLASRVSPLRRCDDPSFIDGQIAKQTIAAWDEAEKRAPLDPRFSGEAGSSILFARAILHTKLATTDHLRAAARDYEAILERRDSNDDGGLVLTLGNLAETKMMLGDLDRAITVYRQALKHGAPGSTTYGLAVALDRDERTDEAIDLIRSSGDDEYRAFRNSVDLGDTFFVPRGEVFYYYALIEQAFGNDRLAADYWRMYIQSGAHPQYQPRAKAHLAALLAKKKSTPPPPRTPPFPR